jgi:AcrR family transcriptional regulator
MLATESLNRAERRKQRTRAMLLKAAAELLIERGYMQVTLQAITNRADVGYGTFYLHFQDKDDIVWEVVHAIFTARTAEIEAALANETYPRREYLSWVAIFEYVAQEHKIFLDIFGNSAVISQRYRQLLVETHRRNLEQGKYQAPVDLPLDFQAQISAGVLWTMMLWYAENPTLYTPQQVADMLFETLFRQPPPR